MASARAAMLALVLVALFGEASASRAALRHAPQVEHVLLAPESRSPTKTTWTTELASLFTRVTDINTWLFHMAQKAATHGSFKVDGFKADVPPAKVQEYFRPVSTTVQCVMALTIISVMLHTALSISRNVDEFSGFETATVTRTLNAAQRGTSLAPMLCMLFVGCRMFVLATTEGLGEPPKWAKNCMYTASAGMCLQFLIVILLRVPAKQDEKEDDDADYDRTAGKLAAAKAAKEEASAETTSAQGSGAQDPETPIAEEAPEEEEEDDAPVAEFDHATGEQNDAHPVLKGVKLKKEVSSLKPVFYGAQVLSMMAVYGGVTGVLLCIATFPRQTTQVSPAVVCTCWLTALFFVTYLILWTCRELPDSDTNSKLLHAALSMSSVVRKAPMFAVLFLVSRMRALQLNPPHGMPPPWMQAVFIAITVLMYIETIVAAVVGYTGTKAKAYYGVYIFNCEGKGAHIVQHTCALITYFSLFLIAFGAEAMKDANGGEVPLSTTFRCTLRLAYVYFGIMCGQTVSFFLEDVLEVKMPILQNSFVAAGISLGFAPLLCILFVATRMRALQITQQMGAPPGWAQDCMVICVFVTWVQAVCCLVMPIFVGSAAHVDDEGNPDYDTRPMIIAYAVTCVKYVALIFLHGGLIAICCAVFVMTPETAHSGGRFFEGGRALLRVLAVAFFVFLVALLLSSAKVIGTAVKVAIESCDRAFLGVDITIRHAAIGLCKGYVCIKDLVVHQPDKEIIYERDEKGVLTVTKTGNDLTWRNDYILKIETVVLKINLGRLITTLGKEFELENLSFSGIHANIEKPSTNMKVQDSNIDYVLNHIDSLGLVPAEEELTEEEKQKKAEEEAQKAKEEAENATEEAEQAKEAAEKAKAEAEAKKEAGVKEEQPVGPKVILRKIAFGDIGAGVVVQQVPVIGTLRFHPRIPKIVFDDIQRDIFNNREDLTPQETVACIVKALGKKIAKVIVKEIPGAISEKSKEAAKAAVGKSMEGMKKMGSKMKGMFTRKKASDVETSPETSSVPTPTGPEDAEPAK